MLNNLGVKGHGVCNFFKKMDGKNNNYKYSEKKKENAVKQVEVNN